MIYSSKAIIVTLFAIVAISLLSCGSGNAGQTTSSTKDTSTITPLSSFDTSLPKGRLIDNIRCSNQNNQSYALYLPSYYTITKQFPCIYFFDAHARGSMPLKTYKDMAEKFGFVLIGSNVSKNGIPWEVTNDDVKVLFDDTHSKINIDPKRIYTSGFSGGSRVASSIAVFDGGVAGVIGSAAGFPSIQNKPQNKFDYFGLVGVYDFNLNEMMQLDETLQQTGFSHQLLIFNGVHGWPPTSDFLAALLWMQVNAIRENLQPKNDTLITAFKDEFDKLIKTARSSGDLIEAHELLDGIVRTLDGLVDVSAYKKQITDLIANPVYKNEIVIQQQLQQVELSQQQELQQEFTKNDEKWWTKKIAELNQKAHGNKLQESQMYKRLLNYLGLVSYLNSSLALNHNDLTNAAKYLKVFKMADPKNPDCSYLTAIYFMKKGDTQQTVYSLNEAALLGYSDALQLTSDPIFSNIENDAGFKRILDKVLENYSK